MTDYFVPGVAPSAAGLLGSLLPTWPEGVARHFVETYTHPDAIVLDPFVVDDIPVREAAAAGRRLVATNSNPLVVLALRERLSPPEPDELRAAATRLGDSLKRGVPLREHLNQLYRTRCPTCNQRAVADYFIWSREPADPRQKWVDCEACGQAGLAAVDKDDIAVLDEVETRGLHYWYLLDRVASSRQAPGENEARAHAETLLELYTPRALYALADLLMKIEATFEEDVQGHLKAVLLACLDAASNLFRPDPPPGDAPSGSGVDRLRPPRRFVERNVWQLFETSVENMAASATLRTPLPLQPDLHWVTRVPSSGEGLVWVHNLGVGAVGRGLTPECVSLVLTTPPRPDPVFWSLAYLWTGWIFGFEEAAKLKSLALKKWPDWAWYVTTMTTALRALRPVFRFDGACVIALHGWPPQGAFALVLAALAAGYDVESWQHRATGEHQFTLVPARLREPAEEDPEALGSRVVAESTKAATRYVRARGEPVQAETLQIAAWHRLMRKGVLEIAQGSVPPSRVLGWLNSAIGQGLDEAREKSLVGVSGDAGPPAGWWLRNVGRGRNNPLSDRVEEAVLTGLRDADAAGDEPVEERAFIQAIYRRFNGPLTPDTGLAHACLNAYGEETSPGHWRLRPDEREAMWEKKQDAGIRDLLALAERLAYRSRRKRKRFDLAWEEEGRPWATFTLVTTANVARFLPHLDSALPQQEIRWRNLVIPAARTGLWQHKLGTHPWLAQMIQAGGWTFIKLEHLQALTAQEALTRHDLKAIVGLVPPVESGAGQLPLF